MQRINTLLFLSAAFLLAVLFKNTASAQVSVWDENRRGSLYFSVGSNSPTFNTSTINITQSQTGNNYNLEKVNADNQNSGSTGISNYSFRAGYFFNYNQSWAVELNYDPVNYHVVDGQILHVTGKIDGATVNQNLTFSKAAGYQYYLNGSNFVLVNIVRRFGLFRNKQRFLAFDALAKVGVGPVMPHVLNTIDGKTTESPQFQVSGWNAAAEAALRLTIFRHAFIEVGPKYDYASYSSLNIYDGTATQKLTTLEWVISLGYAFSTTHHNPLFEKPMKSRRVITIRAIYPNEADNGGQ